MTNPVETDISLDEAKSAEPEVVLTPAEEAMLKTMIEHNVFYGHSKSRTNPKMRPFVLSAKSGVQIVDLMKTMSQLDKAVAMVKDKVRLGGSVLFVGTTPATKFIVKETAQRLQMPYVTTRWLGGTLTNFKTILTRINHFKKLEEDKVAGRLQKYTKKERVMIDVELSKLDRFFRGIVGLDKLPSAVVITELGDGEIAAREAKLTKIPAVAFVNTNRDPDLVKYPIASNDRNSKSVAFLLSHIEKAVVEGRVAKEADAAKLAEKAKAPAVK